jgi:hypothetical protein
MAYLLGVWKHVYMDDIDDDDNKNFNDVKIFSLL